MNTARITWTSILILVAVAAGYALAKRFSADNQVATLQTYNIPPGRSEEVKNVLNHVFDSEGTAKVQVFDSGTLVVKAPQTYQKGIEKLVADLADKKLNLKTVHLQYWLVRAEPATSSNVEQIPELSSVLSTINSSQGPRKFVVLDHMGLNTLERHEMVVEDSRARIKFIAKELSTGIELLVDTDSRDFGKIKVDTAVKSGEFVILGQNASDKNEEGHPMREVYHIIKAEISM